METTKRKPAAGASALALLSGSSAAFTKKKDPSPTATTILAPGAFALAIVLVVALTTLIAVFVGTHAWDDGAITLAYSRTFAETGRVALTAASEQVEGFSSVSWFLANALIATLHPGFEGAILYSQLLAAASLAVAILFLFLIARELNLDAYTTAAILIVFSAFGPSIAEISNGMEMTLLSASGLAIVYALYFRMNWLVLVCSVVVFLLTRFEAMVYFAGLLVPLLFRRQFGLFILLAVFGLAITGVQVGARYMVFSDFLPNTIYAKTYPPYSSHGLPAIKSRIGAALEIFSLFNLFIFTIFAFAFAFAEQTVRLVQRDILKTKRDNIIVVAAPIVVVELFNFAIGSNIGYVGRMEFLALPFALLLFGILYEHFVGTIKVSVSRTLLFCISVGTIVLSWGLSAPGPLSRIARSVTHNAGDTAERFDVTPDSYRNTALAVENLRNLLGLRTISFVTPDVGGVGLCCSGIRVVDAALLTNRRLAKDGYGAMPMVLADETPDVIEVHQPWAENAQMFELAIFKDNYRAVLAGRTRLYLRNDHVRRLVEQRKADWCPVGDASCLRMALETHRYVGHSSRSDDLAFLAAGRFLVVKD